jgi:hypothetical protein
VPSDQRATQSNKQQGAKSSSSRSSSFRLDSEPGIRASATHTAPTSAFTLREYLIAHAAATAVPEQHQDYNLQGLCDFVARQYPIIPAHARPYLVIGAVASAQHAAQIHFLAETHGASQEENKRVIAVGAKCTLSNWVIGLRGEPIFPRQQCRHYAVIEPGCGDIPSTAQEASHCPSDVNRLEINQDHDIMDAAPFEASLFPVLKMTSDHSFQQMVDELAGEVELQEHEAFFGQLRQGSRVLENVESSAQLPELTDQRCGVAAELLIDQPLSESTEASLHLPPVTVTISSRKRHAAQRSGLQTEPGVSKSYENQPVGADDGEIIDLHPAAEDDQSATTTAREESAATLRPDTVADPVVEGTLPSTSTETLAIETSTAVPLMRAELQSRSEDQTELVIDLSPPTIDEDIVAVPQTPVVPPMPPPKSYCTAVKKSHESSSDGKTANTALSSARDKQSSSVKSDRRRDEVRSQREQRQDTTNCTRQPSATLRRPSGDRDDRRHRSRSPHEQHGASHRYASEREYHNFQKWLEIKSQ